MSLRARAATVLDAVSRAAGRVADRLDPPRAVLDRARTPAPGVYGVGLSVAWADGTRTDHPDAVVHASSPEDAIRRHPSVVPDDPPSIASGRADLQLVHDAAARDLNARARRLGDCARDDWNRLVENSWHDTAPEGEA